MLGHHAIEKRFGFRPNLGTVIKYTAEMVGMIQQGNQSISG